MIQGELQRRLSSGGGEGRGRASLSSSRVGGRGAQRTIKILVADDDRDTVLSLRLLLSTEGYEVMGVHDAHSVFLAVREFEPDAVLLDIGMPQMTGYDIARELRRTRGNDLLLIAVTAWNKFSDKMAAHIAGFDHHVSKPYQPDEILALLQPLADHLGRL
jgi:two-component system OmpR family response regulator